MSSKPAAISASLVDVRNIAAHKCVRLEIHVPVEQAADVMAAFGWPTMVDPVPVAIARLNPAKATEAPAATDASTPKDKKRWDELPLSQQAAIRCNEVAFQKFMRRDTPEATAQDVRGYCGVMSRADIGKTAQSAALWQELDNQFVIHQRGYEEMRR